MMKIGTAEMLVILSIALLIFGPSRLPALGKILGQAIGTLRHYANTNNWDELLKEEEDKKQPKNDGTVSAESREPIQERTEEKAAVSLTE